MAAEMAAYHGPGTCTFYGTANTNQMLMEFMGLHLPGASFVTPNTPLRDALTQEGARRALSLSPGNEQKLYWGSDGRDTPGSRNLMGLASPAVDGLIDKMLSVTASEDFTAAVRALDRVLMAERLVIPFWTYDVGRIAHVKEMAYPDTLPIYGDGPEYMPALWWYQAK